MPLNPLLIVIVIVVVPLTAWCLVHQLLHWRCKHAVYARQDTARNWQSRFPDTMPVVERVLTIFCDAFMLKDRYKYHLRTDDRVMEIYKNTTGPIADEMQLENLSIRMDDAFGVHLASHLNEETTLADLVDAVLNKSSSAAASSET